MPWLLTPHTHTSHTKHTHTLLCSDFIFAFKCRIICYGDTRTQKALWAIGPAKFFFINDGIISNLISFFLIKKTHLNHSKLFELIFRVRMAKTNRSRWLPADNWRPGRRMCLNKVRVLTKRRQVWSPHVKAPKAAFHKLLPKLFASQQVGGPAGLWERVFLPIRIAFLMPQNLPIWFMQIFDGSPMFAQHFAGCFGCFGCLRAVCLGNAEKGYPAGYGIYSAGKDPLWSRRLT